MWQARAGSRVRPSAPRRPWRVSSASSTQFCGRGRSSRPPRRRSSPRRPRARLAPKFWSRLAPFGGRHERRVGSVTGAVRSSPQETSVPPLRPWRVCGRAVCAPRASLPASLRSAGPGRRAPCAGCRPREGAGQGAAGSVAASGRSRRVTSLVGGASRRSYTPEVRAVRSPSLATRARLPTRSRARKRGQASVLLGWNKPGDGLVLPFGHCGTRGTIYDLASVLLSGPWGRELRGEAFKRARAYVADIFGERADQPQPAKEERWERRLTPQRGNRRTAAQR